MILFEICEFENVLLVWCQEMMTMVNLIIFIYTFQDKIKSKFILSECQIYTKMNLIWDGYADSIKQ
jgi:ABC-type maltose transport system permease subunit